MVICRKINKKMTMQPKINKKQPKVGSMQPVELVKFFARREEIKL